MKNCIAFVHKRLYLAIVIVYDPLAFYCKERATSTIMRQETRIIAETSGEHVCQEFLASDAPGIALRPDEILHRLHLHKTLNTCWPHQSCKVARYRIIVSRTHRLIFRLKIIYQTTTNANFEWHPENRYPPGLQRRWNDPRRRSSYGEEKSE